MGVPARTPWGIGWERREDVTAQGKGLGKCGYSICRVLDHITKPHGADETWSVYMIQANERYAPKGYTKWTGSCFVPGARKGHWNFTADPRCRKISGFISDADWKRWGILCPDDQADAKIESYEESKPVAGGLP